MDVQRAFCFYNAIEYDKLFAAVFRGWLLHKFRFSALWTLYAVVDLLVLLPIGQVTQAFASRASSEMDVYASSCVVFLHVANVYTYHSKSITWLVTHSVQISYRDAVMGLSTAAVPISHASLARQPNERLQSRTSNNYAIVFRSLVCVYCVVIMLCYAVLCLCLCLYLGL